MPFRLPPLRVRCLAYAFRSGNFYKQAVSWLRADLKWYAYDPKSTVKPLQDFVKLVKEDKHAYLEIEDTFSTLRTYSARNESIGFESPALMERYATVPSAIITVNSSPST